MPSLDNPARQAAELDWDAWKLGLEPSALWTTLFDRYNTQPTVIQEDEAFHHDVVEISKEAKTPEQFYNCLEKRRSLRLEELSEAFNSISYAIHDDTFGDDEDRWSEFLRMCNFRSIDTIVLFFATYVPQEYWEKRERRQVEREQRHGTRQPTSAKMQKPAIPVALPHQRKCKRKRDAPEDNEPSAQQKRRRRSTRCESCDPSRGSGGRKSLLQRAGASTTR